MLQFFGVYYDDYMRSVEAAVRTGCCDAGVFKRHGQRQLLHQGSLANTCLRFWTPDWLSLFVCDHLWGWVKVTPEGQPLLIFWVFLFWHIPSWQVLDECRWRRLFMYIRQVRAWHRHKGHIAGMQSCMTWIGFAGRVFDNTFVHTTTWYLPSSKSWGELLAGIAKVHNNVDQQKATQRTMPGLCRAERTRSG